MKHHLLSFIIYADLQWLTGKIDRCKDNPENSSSKKVGEQFRSGFSMPTMLSFKSTENKHDLHGGKDCIQIFLPWYQ